MLVTGNATLQAPAEKVWALMLDPAVLARAIPGCEQLESTGPDRYRGTINVGVGSIKGTFQGDVELTDLQQPKSLVMRASGAGAPGTVKADVAVELDELADGRTELTYRAEAVVGGMVGGVGQRMLTGVTKKMAGEFFSRLNKELDGEPARKEAQSPGAAAVAPADAGAAADARAAQPGASLFSGAASGTAPAGVPEFVKGAVFGAVMAFVGVLIGALIGRRRRD
ncbi:MAG: carbon monoxide dehydrogenase subunit G [Nocardiopsaceae bacterium]|nr:carbon monoxide dehydrogenase subunit G [Nocardiopsaceae bacterium]